jgi:lysozyme
MIDRTAINGMTISEEGLKLIKHFEGCHLDAYLCPANVVTIGWGTTGKVDGVPLKLGMKITQEKADELLKQDMAKFERAVKSCVTVPLSQNQFDALVSFAYNCGAEALRSSTLLKLLNAGNYPAVPVQLSRWNKGGGKVLAGLVRRRAAEGTLFITGKLDFHL